MSFPMLQGVYINCINTLLGTKHIPPWEKEKIIFKDCLFKWYLRFAGGYSIVSLASSRGKSNNGKKKKTWFWFGGFLKWWVFPPNHPFVHRVFHYFHHPFWGVSLFLQPPISYKIVESLRIWTAHTCPSIPCNRKKEYQPPVGGWWCWWANHPFQILSYHQQIILPPNFQTKNSLKNKKRTCMKMYYSVLFNRPPT